MKCIDLYSDTCLSSSVRKIINENVAGARHTFAFLCDDPLFQSEYLQYASCYRAVTKDWDFCAKRFLKQVPPQNSTSKQANIETCCAKQTFYRCVYEFGNMRCRSDAASFLRRIAETLLNVHVYRMSCFPEDDYDVHCSSSTCNSSYFPSSIFLIFISTLLSTITLSNE
ncbi:conserved hypothetical protein [Pediculus humanus corporis]|uniref:Uncharacterized protein n=1 Tax=Pediculus humanus subsp. corporis TaxID=121224 RepID=E0VDX2_PEDHC|nr:uncharacterized protein Phum_PHUM126190 [Pediculus humanus corporis]EEB11578.1 conserved hypothetical protein [Pediculus humanus corporis]